MSAGIKYSHGWGLLATLSCAPVTEKVSPLSQAPCVPLDHSVPEEGPHVWSGSPPVGRWACGRLCPTAHHWGRHFSEAPVVPSPGERNRSTIGLIDDIRIFW